MKVGKKKGVKKRFFNVKLISLSRFWLTRLFGLKDSFFRARGEKLTYAGTILFR